MVLMCLKIPEGLLNFMKKLYDGNKAFMTVGGVNLFLFMVISSVLQGCPLSGSLFVICMDPILFMFEKHIVKKGLGNVLACADDIGVSLAAAKHIKII